MTTTLEYSLETYQKDDGLWYWLIRKTDTGKLLEKGNHGSPTEQDCRDSGAPFIGDWFAGYMSEENPPVKDTEEWLKNACEGQQRMSTDEGYCKAITRRGF